MSTKRDDGGPAFPKQPVMELPHGTTMIYEQGGMSLRDYFAAHASEEDVGRYVPDDIQGIAELLEKLGRIAPNKHAKAWERYTTADYNWLRSWARYQFADDMLKARAA